MENIKRLQDLKKKKKKIPLGVESIKLVAQITKF